MSSKKQCDIVPAQRTEPVDMGFHEDLLHDPPLGSILPAKINESTIVRNSMSAGIKDVCISLAVMINTVTFRTAFKAMVKNSEK